MIRSLTALVLAGFMAIGAVQPAQATPTLKFDFTYSGEEDGLLTASGGGSFTIANKPSVGLGDVTDFFFVATATFSPSKAASYVYGLSDLISFSATLSDNSLTSLMLSTPDVPQANGDNVGKAEFFVQNVDHAILLLNGGDGGRRQGP